jgi:predicted transcriptional regulator of viral defense system
MALYTITGELAKMERAVFTVIDIARVGNVSKKSASVYINRMLKKKLLFRIEKNKVSITDDHFIVASQIILPAYLSLTTALYLLNAIQQVVDKVYVITTRQKKSKEVFGVKTHFIKVDSNLMFGYSKVRKGNSFIMLADIEKTILDCLYFQRYCSLQYLCEALKKADIVKLESYVKRFKKESVTRRLGYLLDLVGIKHNLKRKTNTPHKLNPLKRDKGKFNKKWYLYINEEIKC